MEKLSKKPMVIYVQKKGIFVESKHRVDKNRLSPVKKVQVRFVASDRRVACDHVAL